MNRTPVEPPSSCFWELNRRCTLSCGHCRVEAGPEGDAGLPLATSLVIADQLVALGTSHVILTGGEPILYPGWAKIAQRLSDGGVRVRLFSSGVGLDDATIEQALNHGVDEFAISLDGPRATHERLRPPARSGQPSCFDSALAAIESLIARGVTTRVVTQVNRLNIAHLEATYRLLDSTGVVYWLVHLCQGTGRAGAAETDLLCAPADVELVVRVLALAAREKRVVAPLTCSLGYFTIEELLRGRGGNRSPIWKGCGAGVGTIAISSTGGVKGCTTLPDEFETASVLEKPLQEIWDDAQTFPYTREWSRKLLNGSCRRCEVADSCRGGCPAVAYGATGSIGANPYCLRVVRGVV